MTDPVDRPRRGAADESTDPVEATSGRLAVRSARRASWDEPVARVRFADRHVQALAKLDIVTVGDLLRHLPSRYVDLSQASEISAVREGEQVTVAGVVRGVRVSRPRPRLAVVSVALFDGSGYMFGVWYNQAYVADRLQEGTRAVFSGAVRRAHGRLEMNAPFFETLEDEDAEARGPHAGRIIPVYPATAKLSTTWLRRLVFEALATHGDVFDPLPAGLRLKYALPPLARALAQVHFPDDLEAAERARRRLAYDDLLYLQLGLAARRHFLATEVDAFACRWPSELARRYVELLPFRLTDDQRRAMEDVGGDMSRPHPMNRLLYGEVGSGKTAVAAAALVTVADGGAQAAMMAPTEVLAEQYARRIGPDLDALGVRWARLVGSTKAAERRRILEGLASGSLPVVFGTHALIEGTVAFARLGLAIVDEQHRFGVRQRVALAAKGKDEGAMPHVLVMSATPIPRTLAMTLYGDLDVSVLAQRPAGAVGARVTTKVCDRRHRTWAYDLVRSEVKAGHQAFIVCPIIDPSDSVEVRSVSRELERLRNKEFWGLALGVLHGKMSAEEKDETMSRFAAAELDVLVATTVIEVGIDVPNATVMVVEDAERFGLAQLHQLRGRVGRGDAPGHCLLFADPTTDQGKARMAAMEQSSDGFALAEMDLEIRGPGELLGARQSGLFDLGAARLGRDMDLLQSAREDALAIVAKDPRLSGPLHGGLAREVLTRFADGAEWLRA